jgi:hypothetical protein
MPLPNTRVIPTGWSAHHRPVAEGGMTAEGTITRAASTGTVAVFDEAAGVSVPPTPTVVYQGVLRLQRSGADEHQITVAGREVTIRDYTVSYPTNGQPSQANDVLTITSCDDNPGLAGEKLRIRDARIGSLVWQRDYIAEHRPNVTR